MIRRLTTTRTEHGLSSKNTININPKTGELLRHGHIEDYETVLRDMHGRVAAVIMECIHGKLP
jgi:ornithine--oxo-acid transaminase